MSATLRLALPDGWEWPAGVAEAMRGQPFEVTDEGGRLRRYVVASCTIEGQRVAVMVLGPNSLGVGSAIPRAPSGDARGAQQEATDG